MRAQLYACAIRRSPLVRAQMSIASSSIASMCSRAGGDVGSNVAPQVGILLSMVKVLLVGRGRNRCIEA